MFIHNIITKFKEDLMVKEAVDVKKIKKSIGRYKKVNYVFLFGSSLEKMHPMSDIDILIGGRLNLRERVNLASELELLFKRKVDIVLIEEVLPGMLLKIFSKGSPILIRSKDKLKKDYFRSFYSYDDELNIKRIREEKIKRDYSYGK